jgi:DNA-binding NtrC family response regulator
MVTPFLFGTNERMKELERRVKGIARSCLPVLIEGSCGTGKEALAGLIHQLTGCQGDFTRITCLPSGPMAAHPIADLNQLYRNARGSLFLRNVHLLSPEAQEQLLMAIEQATPSEEMNKNESSARLISSATESLEALVTSRKFSPALYYRLSVYRILLPPLRERSSDIPALFTLMTRRAANGVGTRPEEHARLMEALSTHDWPGNLRELQNVARAYAASGDIDEVISELSRRPLVLTEESQSMPEGRSLKEQVKGASRKLESEIILRTLEQNLWNRRRTAQMLQISYRSLLYKMKSCDLRVRTHKMAG